MVYAFCLFLSSPLSISLWMFRFLVNNFFKYSESALRSHGDASLQFQFMSFCAMFSYCCSPFDSLSVQCVFVCVFCSGWWEERSLSVKIADWMLFVHHMSCDMKVPTLDLHARIEPAKVFNQLRRLRLSFYLCTNDNSNYFTSSLNLAYIIIFALRRSGTSCDTPVTS